MEFTCLEHIKIGELYFLKKNCHYFFGGKGLGGGIKKADLNDLAIIMLRAFRM